LERRVFLSIVGAAGLVPQPSSGLLLTAFAAESLPQSAVLRGYAEPEPETIFELRRYRGSLPAGELLTRHGIHPIFEDQTTILVPFANLAQRDEAWSSLGSDRDWHARRIEVTLISLYRVEIPPREDPPDAGPQPH